MKVLASSSLIALLLAATWVAPAAAASQTPGPMAPRYVSSEPSDGEMMEEAPDRVEVTFDEPLDPSSKLEVTDECGRQVDDGNVEVEANAMSVGIALKPIGEYEVAYLAEGLGGLTGQNSGTFDFMVHHGPSCDGKSAGGHEGHGDGNGSGNGNENGSDNHGGDHGGGGGNDDHSRHSGSRSDRGTDHSSMDHGSTGPDHSSMNHAGAGGRKKMHGAGKHGSGKHGRGKHGGGKHGDGAHGLLDALKENKNQQDRPLAAGPGDLTAPDGRAIALALGLSLLMGVVGGWFLRVSGAP